MSGESRAKLRQSRHHSESMRAVGLEVDDEKYLSEINADNVNQAHKRMMSLALSDAGLFCRGVKAIEVWVYTRKGRLQLAENGTWIDPVYFEFDDPEKKSALEELEALYNSENVNSLAPGEGLAGALWADTSMMQISQVSKLDASNANKTSFMNHINWRDVRALAEDPDQPVNDSLPLIAKAGFHRAAGVPFHVRGVRGIVVYLARSSASLKVLTSRVNVEYMISSTEHIGSVQALKWPRKIATIQKSKDINQLFIKAKEAILMTAAAMRGREMGREKTKPQAREQAQINATEEQELKLSFYDSLKIFTNERLFSFQSFMKVWYGKMRGGNVQPPPGMPRFTAFFVVTMAFINCFILAICDKLIREKTKDEKGGDIGFEFSQIASMAVMIYTLTASPAAQPRSIILGRLISSFVGLTVGLLPNTENFREIRFAGAVSIASGLMAMLGVAHPPGGGLANLFLRYHWGEKRTYIKIGLLVLQDTMFIFLAAAFNNMSSSKSYPTYWGHLPNMVSKYVRKNVLEENKKKKKDAE